MPNPKPSTASLEVSYDVSPTYSVVIPASVSLSDTVETTRQITATDVRLAQNAKIVVTIDSASNTASRNTFNAKIGDSTANYTIKSGNTNVSVGGTLAEFASGTGEQSKALEFSKATGATYAGKSESSSKKAETVSAYSPKPNANPATGAAGGVSLGTAVLLAAIGIARNKGSKDEE